MKFVPGCWIVGRGDTTTVDVYLTPHIGQYLKNFTGSFRDGLRKTPLFFIQSQSGHLAVTDANFFL